MNIIKIQWKINENSLTNRLNRFIMGYNIVKPIKPMKLIKTAQQAIHHLTKSSFEIDEID